MSGVFNFELSLLPTRKATYHIRSSLVYIKQALPPTYLFGAFVFVPNVLLLASDNECLGIVYSLFMDRQNNFLPIFSTKFVVKCATKN